MASQIEIVNLALIALGQDPISALTDDVRRARSAASLWTGARDQALRIGAWNFAIVRSIIAADSAVPSWGFAAQYTLPGDWMRAVQIGEWYPGLNMTDYRSGDEARYRLEGGKILAVEGGPLKVRYVSNAKDVGEWDPAFCEVMVYILARKLTADLTESVRTKKSDLDMEYMRALKEARQAEAFEKPPEQAADDTWIVSRIGS